MIDISKSGLNSWAYELSQKLKWWCSGINTHCIPLDLFWDMPTEKIVELYNVELSYFKQEKGL